ncbi:MAG: NAD(P)H-hydrate dehydratase [Cyanobacteria bacterium P01_C01_bin.89]
MPFPSSPRQPRTAIAPFAVTAAEMRGIEGRVFAAGMPVAALMEKVGMLITQQILQVLLDYIDESCPAKIGVLVGPGHNGGDALVVARELWLRGFSVQLFHPFERRKPLTDDHWRYCKSLDIPIAESVDDLLTVPELPLSRSPQTPNIVLIDGLFGFGLEREITGELAAAIAQINASDRPILSIDLPSGIHTDTGAVLGTAIEATQTFCLGLWKRSFLQDAAIAHQGKATLIDFDLPLDDIRAVLPAPNPKRITPETWCRPAKRSPLAHKYTQGHLLLIVGSQTYSGAAILAGLGARASGVGMLTIAVPASLKPILTDQLPEALVIGCPETDDGAIAQLPDDLLEKRSYDGIAVGCGLTVSSAQALLPQLLQTDAPLILDADALTALAQTTAPINRTAPTILTPHPGEFKRLCPQLSDVLRGDRLDAAAQAAQHWQSLILLKGARTVLADAHGNSQGVAHSTPALARGGSGDVLAGLLGGLWAGAQAAKNSGNPWHGDWLDWAATAAGWHAEAGILAAEERSPLGVDGQTLAQSLMRSQRS